MEEAYVELRGVPAMKGSLNAIVSSQRKGYRPPSLSESFAWSAENVLRANASTASLDLLVVQSPPTSPQTTPPPPPPTEPPIPYWTEARIYNQVLRFLFHITLISIFESIFFFYYVSSLEDNGINNTVGQLLNGAVSSCQNSTVLQRNITNDVLDLFFNSSILIESGNNAFTERQASNARLNTRSWIYVGSLSGLFLFFTTIALLRRVKIKWKKLVAENMALVTLLGAYEYTFFSTVIFPYTPISGDEILRNAVYEFQSQCGLFTTP